MLDIHVTNPWILHFSKTLSPLDLAANPKASAAGEGFTAAIWQKLIASDVNC